MRSLAFLKVLSTQAAMQARERSADGPEAPADVNADASARLAGVALSALLRVAARRVTYDSVSLVLAVRYSTCKYFGVQQAD